MSDHAYIEQLRVCPLRPTGPLPRVSARLIALVQEFGALDPIVVRQVGEAAYEILSNVETWIAAQRTQLERVPIRVLPDISDEEATEILRATFAGIEADPIDEAEYFQEQLKKIMRGGSRYRAVAKLAYLTGQARPYISHSIRLLKLPVAIQEMVRDGRLSAGHARTLVSVANKGAQMAIANKAINEGLSVRQVELLARQVKAGGGANPRAEQSNSPQPTDPDTQRLQNKIAEQLGCAVFIDTNGCSLTISYHNLDILDGVLEKMGVFV